MDGSIPKAIGRYEIIRHLGTGAMGFVYLARDPDLERSVAIKTLRDLHMEEAALKTFLERFRNEARAAARLQHPAIVQVYDVGEDEDVGPYLVFEYVPGTTLKTVLRERGPMNATETTLLAVSIADAIDLAHREGILHRDIKPENLLVTETGQCKLADFGVSRLPDAALTHEGQFLGTPCYSAPETLSRAHYSTKSDLFSFGALLYEVVTGVRAFPGNDAVAVAHQVIHAEPPPPSAVAPSGTTIPAAVDTLIMKALAKDPAARPETAAAIATSLRRAFSDAGFSDAGFSDTVAADLSGKIETDFRRRPYGILLAILGIAALGVATVFALRDGGFPHSPPSSSKPHTKEVVRREPPRRRNPRTTPSEDASSNYASPTEGDAGDTGDAGDPTRGSRGEDPEEQAKFALDRARRAIAAGDLDDARNALLEAQRLDPGNDDIVEVTRALGSARKPSVR